MQYTAIITTADADVITLSITAPDARTAHSFAATACEDANEIRVYPTTTEGGAPIAAGIARGALMVARRTAINTIRRTGGNNTQNRIERELAAASVRCHGAETAHRIQTVIGDYSADTQDFYSIAATAIAEGVAAGLPIDEQYHGAFLALNTHIRSQRAATEYELSTEFILSGGGDLVAINAAISAIIKGGERWTPTDGGEMDAETAARLGEAIHGAMHLLTPTQRRIAELMGRGYSQRRIAEMTKRALATVETNIAIMRGKVAQYIRDNAPEFVDLLDGATIAAAAARGMRGGRTEEGAEREKANCKARHSAEYYRAYRARKAAKRAVEKGE